MGFFDKIKSFFTSWLSSALQKVSEEALHLVTSMATVLVRNMENTTIPGDNKKQFVLSQLMDVAKEAGLDLAKQELNLIIEQALKNVRDSTPVATTTPTTTK